ncbi:MAG: hypothetical protein IJJ74_00040 [Eubacterium sp.]|nr:hypothetical protein [Eubacterium sp.]
MKDDKIWEVLGIEPGSDEETIRNAYRIKLADTNPEDDPEGFKILREAYEAAIEIINRPPESEQAEEEDDSPEAELIKKVEELYFDVFRRNDPAAWKDIFEDPLIEGLDTVDEVRRRFLRFTMSHFVYSEQMWKEFDNIFRIVDEQAALSEEFPPDYIGYIVERVVEGDYFVYTEMMPADDPLCSFVRSFPIEKLGDYQEEEMNCSEDVYIRSVASLLPLYASVDSKYASEEDREAYRKELADRLVYARQYDVFHPFEGSGLMLYYYISGEYEKSFEIARAYVSDDAIDRFDNFSVAYAAHVIMENCLRNGASVEGLDKLAERLKDIVSANRRFSMAHFAIAQYYHVKEDYTKASEHILNASEFNESSIEIEDFLRKNDKCLIEYYRNRIESQEATDNDYIELGWGLLRDENTKNTEITEMLDKIKPEGELEYNYYNLYARCLVKIDDFERADPYVRRWHELLLELRERYDRYGDEDFTDEEKKRLTRLGYSYYLLAVCENTKGNKEEAEKDYIASAELAETKNDKVIFRKVLGEFYHKENMYNKAFDVWSEIIAIEPRFNYAYIMRQEASFKTGRARQVVDDFFEIINFASEYKMAYVYAAKVFNSYNQTEDVMNVVAKAEENNAVSPQLLFEKAKTFRKNDSFEEAVTLYAELEKGLEEKTDESDAEKKADETDEADAEKKAESENKEEADNSEASVDNDENDEANIENKAGFYAEYGYSCYEYACELRKKSQSGADSEEDEEKDYEALYKEYIAKAWDCVNKGLAVDERQLHIHWLITDLLEHEGKDASEEYNKMKELFPEESSVDFEFGCYLDRKGKRDEAAEQFRSTAEKDPEHQDAYGKLTDYYIDRYEKTEEVEDYDKAIENIEKQITTCDDAFFRIKQALAYIEGYEFEKALEAAELAVKHQPDNIFAYNAKGYALMMLDRLEEAEETFRTGLTYMQTPRRTALQNNFVYCLERQYKYKEAYEFYAEFCKTFNLDGKDYLERKAKLLKRMTDYEGAEELYGQSYDNCAAKYMASEGLKVPKAPRFKIYELVSKMKGVENNRDDMMDLQLTMMDLYVLSGNKKRFDELTEDIMKYVEKELGKNGIEKHLNTDFKENKELKAEIDDRMSAIQMVGMHMLYVGRNFPLAERCLELTTKIIDLFINDKDLCYSLEWSRFVYMRYAESCYRNKHYEKAAEAAKKGMQIQIGNEKNLERYLNYHNNRPRRLSEVAKFYFYMGEKEKAYKLIEEMARCGLCSEDKEERCGLCSDCHESKCYEVYLTLAKFAELEDNNKLALELYQKAHDITDDDSEVEIAIKLLSER